ncbi:hypothetical protein BC826DRAFT_1000876 [Russula brevipes]|nr:hypothetical protein BC826DRAFT_1000876 [Russula brevipes]
MPTRTPSLPPARALMAHSDDPRHILYVSWIRPDLLPYMRGLLAEPSGLPGQMASAGAVLQAFAEPDTGTKECRCLEHTVQLRTFINAFRTESLPNGHAWRTIAVAMSYFVLVTDFFFMASLTEPMKVALRDAVRGLQFTGPVFTGELRPS